MEEYPSGDFPDDDQIHRGSLHYAGPGDADRSRRRKRKRKQIIAGLSFLIILALLMPLATLLWAPLLKPLALSVLVRFLSVLRFIAMTSAISAGIITTSHQKSSDEHSGSKGKSQRGRSRNHSGSDGRHVLYTGKGKNAVTEDLGKDHSSSHRGLSSVHPRGELSGEDATVKDTVYSSTIRHRGVNQQQGDSVLHSEGSSSRLAGNDSQQIHEDKVDLNLADHGRGEIEELDSLGKLGRAVGPSRRTTNEEGSSGIMAGDGVGSPPRMDNQVSSSTNMVDEVQNVRANPFPSASKLQYRSKHSSSDVNLDQLVHTATRDVNLDQLVRTATRNSPESNPSSSTSSRRRRPTSLSYDFDNDYARALRWLAPPPETILGTLSTQNTHNNPIIEGSTTKQVTRPLIDAESLVPWRKSAQPVDPPRTKTRFSRDDLSPSADAEAANLELEKQIEEFISRTHDQWVKQKQTSLERRKALLKGRNVDFNKESKGKSPQ